MNVQYLKPKHCYFNRPKLHFFPVCSVTLRLVALLRTAFHFSANI